MTNDMDIPGVANNASVTGVAPNVKPANNAPLLQASGFDDDENMKILNELKEIKSQGLWISTGEDSQYLYEVANDLNKLENHVIDNGSDISNLQTKISGLEAKSSDLKVKIEDLRAKRALDAKEIAKMHDQLGFLLAAERDDQLRMRKKVK